MSTSNDNNATSARAAATALLHNHAAMIELNPLVQSYALCDPDDPAAASLPPPDSSSSSSVAGGATEGQQQQQQHEEASATYRITDTLPLLPGGLWSSRTTYAARFVDRADGGLETVVRAALGVESRSVWVISSSSSSPSSSPSQEGKGPGEGDKLLLRETATVTCPWAVKAFVEGTIKKAHKELGHAFVERLARGDAAAPVDMKEKKKGYC